MRFLSRSFANGARIPPRFAAGVPYAGGVRPGPNRSPELEWSDAPAATRSFALLCHDPDVPAQAAAGAVPYSAPRVVFYHWVLVDIPLGVRELAEGADSSGFVPRGKPTGRTRHGRRGANGFGEWLAADPELSGTYGGYDGPWPPLHDERVHRYVFELFALDVAALDLPERFDGPRARAALEGHALASAAWVGRYALDPDAR